ncbi:MAG: hypothetical protein K0Q79_3095 [Flavipsychrobacter sp.]|jgi:hypothetical protein|nr:hypothetical protein [Flavipsychrobacter sp.]
MLKTALKGIGYTIAVIFGLLILYCVLFAIGPNGKCIVCTTQTVTDTVTGIFEGGVHDVVFSLKHHKSYYINRGLENGLRLDSLNRQVLDKQVTISYASPSSHINHFEVDGKVIFSELKD